MPVAKTLVFKQRADGTLLVRRKDGSFRPVKDRTDRARIAKWSDAEIEKMAASDPDHPALDDEFWRNIDEPAAKEAISIKLDRDILTFFRKQGRGYQTRINAVLRSYMRARRKAG
jgi:uncharacterized protein (DUF4415 family)